MSTPTQVRSQRIISTLTPIRGTLRAIWEGAYIFDWPIPLDLRGKHFRDSVGHVVGVEFENGKIYSCKVVEHDQCFPDRVRFIVQRIYPNSQNKYDSEQPAQ